MDESAITGESAPVVREAGGDRSAVTGGTRVLSDWIVIRITSDPGQSFLDKMIAMVEGAARKKTPNEIALEIFLVALSNIFILVVMALYVYSLFSAKQLGVENPTSVTSLVALLVCLAPTTIGALLSAIGIAGMSRLNEANVLAMSGRAIEAAGDVDTLLLDKTGTITLGNRQASEFIPVDGHTAQELADAAQLASLPDETPEGRSVVILAKEKFGIRGRNLSEVHMEFIPFTAKTRMSGVNTKGSEIRKGAADSMKEYVEAHGGIYSGECGNVVKRIADQGGKPLVVSKDHIILGVIYLKDIIKAGVKEKFVDLRKLAMIRKLQAGGHMVAMTGDGTNDVAKYFAIIPDLFMGLYPGLAALNIMGLHSAQSAIFSAIIYNALIIVALIPLALKGVKYREVSAGKLLSRSLLVYGAGGIIAPFICIKLIDMMLTACGLFA